MTRTSPKRPRVDAWPDGLDGSVASCCPSAVDVLRHIEGADLISNLEEALSAIEAGAVFEVSAAPSSFILGPPSLGAVFAIYDDKEYGWPVDIEAAEVRSIEDLMPRHRRHPVIVRDGTPVAMSIHQGEYDDLLARA